MNDKPASGRPRPPETPKGRQVEPLALSEVRAATDPNRLLVEASHLIVDLAERYHEQDDSSVLLPRSIATGVLD